MYRSEHTRIAAKRFRGRFDEIVAAEAFGQFVLAAGSEHHLDLRAEDRRRIFNLGYFTWVEQQGVSVADFRCARVSIVPRAGMGRAHTRLHLRPKKPFAMKD